MDSQCWLQMETMQIDMEATNRHNAMIVGDVYILHGENYIPMAGFNSRYVVNTYVRVCSSTPHRKVQNETKSVVIRDNVNCYYI